MAYPKQNKTVLWQLKIPRILKHNFLTLQNFRHCYRDQVITDAL